MQLTHIVPSLEARYGGPSQSVRWLSLALAEQGHAIQLLATHPENEENRLDGKLEVKIFRRDWPGRLCPSAGLRAALQQSAADIVHHHALWLRTLHYAHQRTKKSDARLVISPRGMMSPWAWQHHPWRKRFARALVHPGAFAAAQGWHATSEEEASDIRRLGFQQPICVAPNGVNAPTAIETERATAWWRERCPDAFQRPTALFYGRFHPKKRVLELIDLWIQRAPPDWLLLVVGIPETYSPAQLTEYARVSSRAPRVRVFDGTGVPAPYPAASLFLLPSHSENFGLTVAEALAYGLPAVVTDATPWKSLSATGHGWCVAWERFGDAMREAMQRGPDALKLQGQQASRWVLENYSWAASARTLADFYRDLSSP
jgi:glycosyltransferase involved in cell wall biosynthesis